MTRLLILAGLLLAANASAQTPAAALAGTWQVRPDTTAAPSTAVSPERLVFGPSDLVVVTFVARSAYTVEGDQVTILGISGEPVAFSVRGDTLVIEDENSSGGAERYVMARTSGTDGIVGAWRVVRVEGGPSGFEGALFRFGADAVLAVEMAESGRFRVDGDVLVIKSPRGTERRRGFRRDGDTLAIDRMTARRETAVFERAP